ncbi:hypothetical protein N1851_021688 [Merluccius polli]|uniref:YqaJ viral recombinase domain-containing protein n=1 Tax=Merluccius polli TaxID=89951 RepID=A0AA47MJS6_MERPO|nr:hypothetical protein N1851_021688 [Merluccius polli]
MVVVVMVVVVVKEVVVVVVVVVNEVVKEVMVVVVVVVKEVMVVVVVVVNEVVKKVMVVVVVVKEVVMVVVVFVIGGPVRSSSGPVRSSGGPVRSSGPFTQSLSSLSFTGVVTYLTGTRSDTSEWINDEKKWPRLQWPDIHSYLIETPSLYSRESLKSYTTLDAYSYVTDNHVQDILLHDYKIENFVTLKTKVLPSQRQGKRTEMYNVWVILNKKNNCILTANCTCMAGYACCSTDAQSRAMGQVWKDRAGLYLRDKPVASHIQKREVTDEHINKLKLLEPKAAVLTSLDCSDTDTASESDKENEDPLEPLAALYDENLRGFSSTELQEKSDETFSRLRKETTQEKCENLECITKNQAQSQAWQTHRIGRITSTTLHRVCTVRAETANTNLVKQIMHYDNKDLSSVDAIHWGREHEPTARKCYTESMRERHQNFNVELCGLVVHPDNPHLGASPDGVANCSCCGRGAVEIKCPYKYRDGLKGSSDDTDFCLDKSFHLKKNHKYYHQVQLHMFVCGV